MKTITDVQDADLSVGLVSESMGLHLNPVSFEHIISNLYKDPLSSIIRELVTNGLESHMVSNSDKRVAIQLPTLLDKELVIRDFGTGLSHEDVMKYLNSLFSSSKAGDNTFAGGFGLTKVN